LPFVTLSGATRLQKHGQAALTRAKEMRAMMDWDLTSDGLEAKKV